MNLIMKKSSGFGLAMAGLDVIALKMLADRNIVEAMGNSIGVGKESDVFEAITPCNEKRAIKFYRIGRISFRDIQRKRNWQFLSKADSKSLQQRHRHWLMVNIEAAKREYDALLRLKDIGAKIPVGYYRAMHCLVLNRIDGRRLVTFKAKDLPDPEYTLYQILKDVRLVYDHGMINADLSEFNVLVDSEDNPWIIDWPQTVSTSHPNSFLLLRRDISNIVRFFNRRFKCDKKDEEAFRTVIGPT